MKRLTFISIPLIFILLLGCSPSNNDFNSVKYNSKATIRGYKVDADSIYFSLDENEINNFVDLSNTNFFDNPYTHNLEDWKNTLIKKEEVAIHSVHVVGNFNNFQLTNNLKKIGDKWELRLAKSDIKGKSGQFGYIVNKNLFITPFVSNTKNYKMQLVDKFKFYFINLIWLTYLFYENEQLGYTIDADSIYFTFDPKDYVSTTHEKKGFEKIINPSQIELVEVTGSFSEWQKRFELTKVGDIYKTSLPLDSTFKNWGEFKYIINKNRWVTPPYVVTNKIAKNVNDNNYNYTFKTLNKENIKGYSVKGDSVIFEWQLEKLQLLNYFYETIVGAHKIKNMYLYGEFNKDDKGNKKLMTKVGDKRYRLAYPVSTFEKGKNYTFIFYINGLHELIPPHDASNVMHTDAFNTFQTLRFTLKL
ncbi:hypothetical protein [Flammeovirga kamogawensis]|uniref:Uncharacterized protein n=1 Tax=Flammeovirga kamogawensis TaxID=373891 RepID=A0ABX8GQ68_9BACT|nr:hypothetical protein [Flammeovirga kamogawensis]MBB6463480.1 hypothetical protein [Flammeovirga kamogawensis]QWG05594.1 hypothetical protein KM029_09380 [Flammeovirga kamogawensis]TRX67426.1 hypothetical protein EO216_04420 [Flammeovirga kamogawensis]